MVTKLTGCVNAYNSLLFGSRHQWRRQRSKGARSFRGRNILEPGHPDALFSLKKLTTFFIVVALKTQSPPTPLRLLSK